MALTVQDPVTPISNANSYQSLVDARTLAVMHAITLPVDDTEAETALIQGFAYIEKYNFCGERTTTTQNTEFPREDLSIRGNEFPNNEFPSELLLSQLIASEAFGNGDNLWGDADNGRMVTSEKVDVISATYADNGKTGNALRLPRLESTIQPLVCSDSGLVQFSVNRA